MMLTWPLDIRAAVAYWEVERLGWDGGEVGIVVVHLHYHANLTATLLLLLASGQQQQCSQQEGRWVTTLPHATPNCYNCQYVKKHYGEF